MKICSSYLFYVAQVMILSMMMGFAGAQSTELVDIAYPDADALKSATCGLKVSREIAPGIHHLHWYVPRTPLQVGPWNINTLSIDLKRPEIEVRVVEAQNGLETTSGICRRVGAIVAVNGGDFNKQGPLGLLVIDGEIRSHSIASRPPRTSLGLLGDKAWIDLLKEEEGNFHSQNPTRWFDWSEAKYILEGGPLLVNRMKVAKRGKIDYQTEGFDESSDLNPDGYAPRTIVGIQKERLFLMTVDGEQPDLSIGMKLGNAAGYLVRMCNAPYGMALDGGDSTTMAIQGKLINFPCYRDQTGQLRERPVANAICVFVKKESS